MNVQPGDEVSCKIYSSDIVKSSELNFDQIKSFLVLNIDKYAGILIYVPPFIFLKDCIDITDHNLSFYDLPPKYAHSTVKFIQENQVCSIVHKLDGMHCSKCNVFSRMAQSNTEDGKFVCWSCRSYPFFK